MNRGNGSIKNVLPSIQTGFAKIICVLAERARGKGGVDRGRLISVMKNGVVQPGWHREEVGDGGRHEEELGSLI